MRDFYPEEMRKREWLFSVWKEVSYLYGFEPYDAPIVESLDLLKRKAGEEISQQLYSFLDKSGREIALRAEMTPSLARMIVSRQNSLSMPVKWFTIAQCFRYERMTKGRKREHYQWNADILGVDDISAETEIISMLVCALKKLGLGKDDALVKINSRKIVEDILRSAEISEDLFPKVMIVIDKKDKVSPDDLVEMLEAIPLDKRSAERITGTFEKCQTEGVRSVLGENENVREIESLLENLGGFMDYISFDTSVVRGLSYYTGTVFEVYSKKGSSRAIAGGGRYAGLLEKIGGKPLSGVGFGFGDVVVMDVLEEAGKIQQSGYLLDYYIIPYDKTHFSKAFEIAGAAREKKLSADIDFKCRKVGAALSEAVRKNARFSVLIFPDELKDGKIKIKNMKTQEEKTVLLSEFPVM
ncbi:histidine--tRNA ligase [candidate division WOR-3 bacterium]|nr:histidine--tRNA ligase [candidate division WOR-3 bacterium]